MEKRRQRNLDRSRSASKLPPHIGKVVRAEPSEVRVHFLSAAMPGTILSFLWTVGSVAAITIAKQTHSPLPWPFRSFREKRRGVATLSIYSPRREERSSGRAILSLKVYLLKGTPIELWDLIAKRERLGQA